MESRRGSRSRSRRAEAKTNQRRRIADPVARSLRSCATKIAFLLTLALLPTSIPAAGGRGLRVTCVGDSTTGQGYPEMLQNLLGSGWTVRNAGVGAATVMEGTLRPYHTTREYADAMNSRPDYVIVMLGTNDANPKYWSDGRGSGHGRDLRGEFRSRYLRLIEELQGLDSRPKILVAVPLAVHPELASAKWRENAEGRRDNLQHRIIPIIREVAELKGLTLIDVPARMGESASLCKGDGVHYTERGYEKLSQAFKDELLQLDAEGTAPQRGMVKMSGAFR